MPNIKKHKQLQLLFYKLANDALLLWIIVFLGLLILEGLVPGYFSAYLSFTKMILILFTLLGVIGYLGRINNLVFELPDGEKILKNETLLVLLILSLALIVNSLHGFSWLIAIIASIGIFISITLLYKILILGKD